MKKKSFLAGTLILAISGIIVRFIGLFYKLPLAKLIGEEGLALCGYPYQLYIVLLAISSTGIPIAISKLVSEKVAIRRYDEAHRIFKITLVFMLLVGALISLILYISSDYLVSYFWVKEAYYSLMGLILAPFFVAIMAVFRGYFQGMQMMTVSAISQVFEALGRLIIGLGLAYLLFDKGIEFAAGGASFGATAGAIVGLMSIVVVYLNKRKFLNQNINKNSVEGAKESVYEIAHRLIKISVPISIGTVAGALMPLVDSLMNKSRLLAAGFSEQVSTILFGRLSAATTLINFPLAISIALSISLVPAISEMKASGSNYKIKKRIEDAFKMVLILIIPAAAGLFILAGPIMLLLFPDFSDSHNILRILTISLILISLNQIVTAALQGLGKVMIPVRNLFIGAIFKIIISFWLVGITSININGAAIGTGIGYLIVFLLNYLCLRKYIFFKLKKIDTIIKPLLTSLIMSVIVFFSYNNLFKIMSNNSIVTLTSIAIGGLFYGLILFLLGGISKKDITRITDMLPKRKRKID